MMQLGARWARWLGLDGLGAGALAREVAAGCMGSLVSIAYCVSYAALIFGGELASGLGAVLWSLLAATAIATPFVAVTSTLPPAIAGPRNPTIAVLSVLAAGIGAGALAKGLPAAEAVRHALVGLALATLATGLVLALLGSLRLGQAVRFVPYPVIAGFLAASGWLLVAGGLAIAWGAPIDLGSVGAAISVDAVARLALALAFVAAVLLARRAGAPAAVLPVLFFGSALTLDLLLRLGPPRPGWYVAGAGHPQAWWLPGLAASGAGLDWSVVLAQAVEIGAVVVVAVMTLLLDVSQLEALRGQAADLDSEFSSNGWVNIAVAPLGGAAVAMAPNSSRLIEEAGGATRFAGVAGGLLVLAVLVSGLDIARLLPTPILGGLVAFLGLGILREALASVPAGRSPLDLALALAIMLAIVKLGYLPGAVLGLVASALVFAFSYSRIGVIRRHVTRATLGAAVERAPEERALLAAEGHRIHVVWLTGYVFFGSSHRTAEAIRAAVGEGGGERRWVVLDMGGVTGIDASALLSLAKLAVWARGADVRLAFAAMVPAVALALREQGVIDDTASRAFATRNDALEQAEEELLAVLRPPGEPDGDPEAAFAAWLARELGAAASRNLLTGTLVRREIAAGGVLCAQGGASDSMELVVSGAVAVLFRDGEGREVRVRRVVGRSVIGEMGFFRHQPRAASVVAETATVVQVMTREAYERLARDDPAAAARFLEFIVRQLADRMELSTREIAALV